MEILTQEQSKQILGGNQNLSSVNTNTILMQLPAVVEDIAIVIFTGNDLEE